MAEVEVCPVCGGQMEEIDKRRTSTGVMCQECAFKQSLWQMRSRAARGPESAAESNDNFWWGFLWGLFFNLFGVLIVLSFARGPNMKRGALFGFTFVALIVLCYFSATVYLMK